MTPLHIKIIWEGALSPSVSPGYGIVYANISNGIIIILCFYALTDYFVQQPDALHAFVYVFRIKFREIRNTCKHDADFVDGLRVQFLWTRIWLNIYMYNIF